MFSVWARAYRILRNDFHKFEVDPKTQYKYHRKMVVFWMFNFIPMNVIAIVALFAAFTGNAQLSTAMSAILLIINTNYSLYANWDTETGDAHGAYASMKTEEIQKQQLPHVDW